MENEKGKLELIGTDQFFRKRAQRVGLELRIGRSKINQVIGVVEDRQEVAALLMSDKGANFVASKRSCEPLHVVLHENLHGRAADGTATLDGHVRAAGDR